MRNFLIRLFNPILSRLFYKMLIIYSLLTLVPLIVVSTTFYLRTSQLIGKKATEDAQQELSKAVVAIDAQLLAIKKRMLDLSERDSIQSYLKGERDVKKGNTAVVSLRVLLNNAKDTMQIELDEMERTLGPYVDNVFLVAPDNAMISPKEGVKLRYPLAYSLLPFEFKRMPEWAFFTDEKRMACDMKIFESGTGEVLGHLVITLKPAILQSALIDFEPGTFFITSSDNVILSATNIANIGKVFDVRGPETQLIIQQKSQYADFHFIRLATPGAGGIVEKQAMFSAAITLIAWWMVFLVTYWILKRITTPIQRLTRLMRRAEKEEYQLVTEAATRDEIGMLCHGYNQLVLRTKDLIDKNYKNELLIREAELKAIRMYINPHFLYNTLEYISIMSQLPEKAIFVPDIVQKLSSIFRFSIMPGEMFVPLETELTFADKYLQIHRYRFEERMQYRIDIPDMFRQVAIPKLLLQPLVENAIIHGVDRLQGGGWIDIEVKEVNYELFIAIRNPVAEQRGGSGSVAIAARKGLGSGLENVNARIRHHFGNAYGAKLSRNENEVTVTVHLPIQLYSEPGEA